MPYELNTARFFNDVDIAILKCPMPGCRIWLSLLIKIAKYITNLKTTSDYDKGREREDTLGCKG